MTPRQSPVVATQAAGRDQTSDPPRRGSAYAELSRTVRSAGLLEKRPVYATVKIATTAAVFVGGWVVFAFLGNTWYQLILAAFFAFMFTQVAFIGHDAGHRQIFRSRRASEILGILHGNLGVGLSYGWWVTKHNRHHSHPNTEGMDPDIGDGALAFTPGQAARRTGIHRLLAVCQAYLFFPMLLLEGVNLHVASVRALAKRPIRTRIPEALLLAAHAAAYLTLLFVVLSPLKALVFLAVQQALFGLYMGCSFAPNHKGMPMLSRDDDLDFLRRQVLTSRNIRGRFVGFVLGGLNYQIEHHLFPSMPRPALPHAQPIVREFCREHGIAYCETGLLASYGLVLRHLDGVGNGREPAGTS